jgi:Trk K+ transport system NAD-binding subunit
VRRASVVFTPDTVIQEGDTLIVAGRTDAVERFAAVT